MIWLIGIILLPFVWWYINYWRYEKDLKTIHGPRVLPFIGSLSEFTDISTSLTTFMRLARQYKGNHKIYFGAVPLIVATELKTIEYFVTSNKLIEKSSQYGLMKNWFRNGLLLSGGDYWRRHRKFITPAFHFKILEDYVKVFDSVGDVLITKLKTAVNTDIDIHPYVTLCTLDVMCESTMGTTVNAQMDENSDYVKKTYFMGTVLTKRIISPYLKYDFIYNFTKTAKKEKETAKVLHGYVSNLIKERRQERSKNEFPAHREKHQPFLDLLLSYVESGENFTDEEIQEEVNMLLFEGHDTTAAAISFCMYSLSKHPDIQEKVYSELESIFGDDVNRPANFEDLNQMKYLDLIIKETLRLYPSVIVYLRKLTETVVIGDQTYPEGIDIMFFPFGTHRNPEYFSNPEAFYPERWLPENTKDRAGGTFAYLPFSAGPRNCIGQRFAQLEMKSIVSHVLRNFKLSPPSFKHELDLYARNSLASKTGIFMRLEPRALK